ncbi:phosphotransferase [Streptomyces sp. TLI_185]|uniref:phosphotransferase n=1 Tax=Streptomyces sp. TLI_185 TaxID=2485151 RepID=UPI001611C31F|nr:phosphotransferase [Streptomyces sp. TLI_185]
MPGIIREATQLRAMAGLPLGQAQPGVPTLLGHGDLPTPATTAAPGVLMLVAYRRPGHHTRPAPVRTDLTAAATWLTALHSATADESAPLDAAPSVPGLLDLRPNGERAGDALRALRRLPRHAAPLTAVHGDFWPGNMLLRGGRVSGVVDWEHARTAGSPLADRARFVVAYCKYLDRRIRPGRRVSGHPGLVAGHPGAALACALDGSGWYPRLPLRGAVRARSASRLRPGRRTGGVGGGGRQSHGSGVRRGTDPGVRPPVVEGGRAMTTVTAAALVACAALVFQPILRPAGPGNNSPILLVAWCVALCNLARRPGVLRLFTSAFAHAAVVWASLLVAAALAHITVIEGISPTKGDRKLFTLRDPNYAVTYWVVPLFMVYAAQRPRSRALRWYGYMMLLWALLLSQSHGGVLTVVVGPVVLAANAAWRKGGLVAAAAVGVAVALSAGGALTAAPLTQVQDWARLYERTELVNTVGHSGASTEQRDTLEHESLELYERQWLTGSGPGTTQQLPTDRQFAYAKEAHDDYLAVLVERGPLGVVALLTLLMSAAWRSARALRAPPGNGFAAQVPRPAGIVAALVGLALAGAYYEVLHFRFRWVLLAMVALLASTPDPDSPDHPHGHGDPP